MTDGCVDAVIRFQHLKSQRSKRRLVLSGTPVQNNITEFLSLLCFLMPDVSPG
jgi:SWI/SNF-related matrix-associated actin-dependent regulator of chromatin subfamily A containing DEAD/H box 1